MYVHTYVPFVLDPSSIPSLFSFPAYLMSSLILKNETADLKDTFWNLLANYRHIATHISLGGLLIYDMVIKYGYEDVQIATLCS